MGAPKRDCDVASRKRCNGCGCSAAWGPGAITYHETVGGCLLPVMDKGKCTFCLKCYDVCPGMNFGKLLPDSKPADMFTGSVLATLVGRSVDEEFCRNSKIGDVVIVFLYYLHSMGAIRASVVSGMMPGEPSRGNFLLAHARDDLILSRKSKYTPIRFLSVLRKARKIDGIIALEGLPC